MRGMDTLIALRKRRSKPKAVFVTLVPTDYVHSDVLSHYGHLAIDIGPDESLTDLDFRPLVGLQVHVMDLTGSERRLMRLDQLVAEAKPQAMFTGWEGPEGFTLRIRRNGELEDHRAAA